MPSNRLFSLLLAALAGAIPLRLPALDVVEVQVRHEGGALDPASVLAFTRTKAGQPFNARQCADDVKNLQATGRFVYVASEVEQTPTGAVVTYIVQSRPRLKRLRIEGGDHYSNPRIKELMGVQVGDLVDKALIEGWIAKVREEYRKDFYPDAQVAYTSTPADEGRSVELEFKIDEGRKAKVSGIAFTGEIPSEVSTRQLRAAMNQKRGGWLSWLTGSGALDRVALDADRVIVRDALRRKGYLDAEVGEAVLEADGTRAVRVEFPITPGPRYRIRTWAVEGVQTFPLEPVTRTVKIKKNGIADGVLLDRTKQGIRDFFGERGYIGAVVSQRLVPTGEPGELDVVYKVTENRQAFIRHIEIRGNARTQDKVIRRELAEGVEPGEVFDEIAVRRSAARLRNMNYFSLVNTRPRETEEEDRYDLVVDVEEQSTGQFMTGAGFSSIDDLIGFVEVSQGNFHLGGFPDNLTGGGQKIKLGLQLGTKRRDAQFSFVEPWFLDRRLSMGFDLYQHDRRYLSDDYDQRTFGGALSLGRSLGSFWRGRTAYSLENIDVYNVSEDASETIRAEEGESMESAITFSLTRDARDAVLVPTRGHYLRLAYKVAGGPFGFDTDYIAPEISASQYFPLWVGHVLSLKGSVETVEPWAGANRVRLFDRTFLGGPRNVRAFKYREVGPKDELGEPIGGQSAAFASVEYTIPLAERFRVATFYDVGLVDPDAYSWDPSLYNAGYGIGIRIDIPGFPLQLDYAWPTRSDAFNDDSNGRVNFMLGYPLF